ncbi:ribosomal protection-like ABC-F family protein [Fictibacillus iocasae]|uniref:Ribosomal protection-like ABC-F family protein n=1 Tax=Fictibacillus iocasae TaxID=2715437 RepID=A0ABW2NME3_9BACL
MIICSLNNVSKMYGGNSVFKNIHVEIHENDRIGLIGRNGTGKTTLFKLIAGLENSDTGTISLKNDVEIGYLEQLPSVSDGTKVLDVLKSSFQELNAIENKIHELSLMISKPENEDKLEKLLNRLYSLQEEYSEKGGYETESKITGVLKGLKLEQLRDCEFQLLSGGEKTKVGLASVLLKEPDLLMLDEPTNHLDLTTMNWLEDYLTRFKGAVVIISHDRYFLDKVCNKTLDLEDGELTLYLGNYTTFMKLKEEQLLQEFHQYKEQQKKIKQMKEAIKRLRDWANRGGNEKFYKRAFSMQKALDRMDKRTRPVMERKKAQLSFDMSDRSGKDVVSFKDVARSFGQRVLFNGIQLDVYFGEKTAIIGDNGTGKSSLIKMIMGESPDSGTVKVGSSVKLGYLTQNSLEGCENKTVLSVFRDAVSVEEGEARHLLAKYLFYGTAVFKKVGDLSGGERTRLRFAQLVHENHNLLLLDEPTNHLDIDSREVLEEALEHYKGTVIAVSHDRYFLNKLFRKTALLKDGTLTVYNGTFDEMEAALNRTL